MIECESHREYLFSIEKKQQFYYNGGTNETKKIKYQQTFAQIAR